jgi:acyl-CoA thioester hydrolase
LSALGARGYLERDSEARAREKMTDAAKGFVTYRGAVSASQCDHIGHMNIVSYGAKFDEANWVFFCEIGLTPSYLRSERHGMAGVQQNISYSRELFAGDVIEIRSRLVEIADKRLTMRHEMRNIETGEIAAACEITAVHLDKQARKACDFPPEVRAAAQALAAAGR